MLTSRCMLPWLRSAPYPALCPCEPLGPVGDMQAVSYGARSRQYSPLLPASLLFWSRLVHAELAMHATLAALGTLPRSMSLWASGPGQRHASRVLLCSFQAVQSTAPGLQLVTSIYRRATTLWAHG